MLDTSYELCRYFTIGTDIVEMINVVRIVGRLNLGDGEFVVPARAVSSASMAMASTGTRSNLVKRPPGLFENMCYQPAKVGHI